MRRRLCLVKFSKDPLASGYYSLSPSPTSSAAYFKVHGIHLRSTIFPLKMSLAGTQSIIERDQASMLTLVRVFLAISMFWLFEGFTGRVQRSSHNDATEAVMMFLLLT
jgi:hypothetical protein